MGQSLLQLVFVGFGPSIGLCLVSRLFLVVGCLRAMPYFDILCLRYRAKRWILVDRSLLIRDQELISV